MQPFRQQGVQPGAPDLSRFVEPSMKAGTPQIPADSFMFTQPAEVSIQPYSIKRPLRSSKRDLSTSVNALMLAQLLECCDDKVYVVVGSSEGFDLGFHENQCSLSSNNSLTANQNPSIV